ncbi:MAG: ABC transporter substrate-binding protein, partial [Desulfomonile tiedjei]|nr:ABC transporter substrate-binding protein [Desulfomonile tiedjei]
ATDPDLPKELGPELIMVAFGDDDQANAIAHFAFDELKTSRAVVWTDVSMDFTRTLSTYFKKRFIRQGGKIASEDFFKAGDKDFSGHITRLKALSPQPDAVFVSAVPGEAAAIVAQLRSAGIRIPILSGDGFDSDIVSAVPSKDMADGVYFSTHSYRGQTRKEVSEFVEAYKKKYDTEPENAFAALGFDAMNLLADAIKRAGTTEAGPLLRAIYATRSFHGVTGGISYARPSHVPIKPISIIGIRNGEYKVMQKWKP